MGVSPATPIAFCFWTDVQDACLEWHGRRNGPYWLCPGVCGLCLSLLFAFPCGFHSLPSPEQCALTRAKGDEGTRRYQAILSDCACGQSRSHHTIVMRHRGPIGDPEWGGLLLQTSCRDYRAFLPISLSSCSSSLHACLA
jgi:hypothetical protein